METAADLRMMLESLAEEDGVFGLVESGGSGSAEEYVYGLVFDAQEAWAPYAIEGSRGPSRPADIAGALTAIDRDEAASVMAHLSAGDLVFPGRLRRDREHAHRAAQRVVKLLGWDSRWWTNIELSDAGNGWNPVSRFTFDGVVVGTGNGFAVALLQVGED
ncbi:hypothetical protein ACNFRX_16065 [Streptomyces griseoaurantiacus]|uniref:hypothetical protein n=1 Tax=Streptomyces griseoaurantiacus TaxID=68213 RepID=UPI003F19C44A